jgi:hypothetical protein
MEVRDQLSNFDKFVWANFSVGCRNRVVAGGAKLAGLSHLKDILISSLELRHPLRLTTNPTFVPYPTVQHGFNNS